MWTGRRPRRDGTRGGGRHRGTVVAVLLAAGCGETPDLIDLAEPPDGSADDLPADARKDVRADDAAPGDDAPPPDAPAETGPPEPEACPQEFPGYGDKFCAWPPDVEQAWGKRCGAPCTARCIGNGWVCACPSCRGEPSCPPSPPVHGTACSPSSQVKCFYDTCKKDNTFVWSVCDGGAWYVRYNFCLPIDGCWMGGGEDPQPCPGWGTCTVKKGLCLPGGTACAPNPCKHEPLSCACAGSLCGPYLVCTGTKENKIVCEKPPDPPGPKPVQLAKSPYMATSVVLGAGYAYWIGMGSDWKAVVRRVPKGGGVVEDFVEGVTLGNVVRSDETGVYFQDLESWTVRRRNHGGGPTTVLATAKPVGALGLSAYHAYWIDGANPVGIRRVPKVGGPVELVVATKSLQAPWDIVADETCVFWTGQIEAFRAPLAGGAVSPLGLPPSRAPSDDPGRIVVDESFVYVANRTTGVPIGGDWNISRLAKSGGNAVDLATGIGEPGGLAVRDGYLYWTTPGGEIRRMTTSGTSSVALTVGQLMPESIAVDATHVYWTTDAGSCGGVWRMPR